MPVASCVGGSACPGIAKRGDLYLISPLLLLYILHSMYSVEGGLISRTNKAALMHGAAYSLATRRDVGWSEQDGFTRGTASRALTFDLGTAVTSYIGNDLNKSQSS